MNIGDNFGPNKRARYTPDPLLSAIYVASGNYVNNLTTLSDSPQVILLNYDHHGTFHIIMRDKPVNATEKKNCSRHHDGIKC